ncbi:hypothetical protein ES707_18436 [subsurface metagenome]
MVLTQSPIDSCIWLAGGGWDWQAAYVTGFGYDAELHLSFGPISYFTGYEDDQCAKQFTNENICAYGLMHGQGGTGTVL